MAYGGCAFVFRVRFGRYHRFVVRIQNAERHEMRIGCGPSQSLSLGFKKAIDYDGRTLQRCFSGEPRGRATDHGWAAIDRDACRIGKKHLAAVRDSFRIDCAMAGAQFRSIRAGAIVFARRPVDSDASKNRLLSRQSGRAADQCQH
jgi:hypothetical protein